MPAYVCTQKKRVQYHKAVNDTHRTTETIKKTQYHDVLHDTYDFIFVWKITHKWSRKARYHDAVHDTCYFNFVGKISHKKPKKHRYHDVLFLLHPTSVEVAKTFINDLRSSATGSQFRLECVSTPPAAARTRSSSFGISDKERRSHSSPSETAPR